MTKKKLPPIPPRPGMPTSCIACEGGLHPKSESYCSRKCAEGYSDPEKPPFRSKWKGRKRKALADPSIKLRKKTRKKTNELIKSGRLKKGPCVVCGSTDVVPHHEDYNNPRYVIWLCEDHHTRYHDGEITLLDGTLRWDPRRLTQIKGVQGIPAKKYRLLEEIHRKKASERPGTEP